MEEEAEGQIPEEEELRKDFEEIDEGMEYAFYEEGGRQEEQDEWPTESFDQSK